MKKELDFWEKIEDNVEKSIYREKNMSKQVLLIVNPNAGKGKVQKRIPEIKKDLEKTGYKVDIINTKKKFSAKDIIKTYNKKTDIIICCGGDGTVNDLVNGIMELEEKPKISFIPLGTVNDFARTIGLSRKKYFKQEIFKKYIKKECDIGKFNKKYFNYVAAFGAFTPVSYVTNQKLKKCFGKFAYFIVAVKYFFKIRTYEINLNIDGKKIEKECIYGSVSNSKSIGGFQWFRKRDIAIDDGKFEVLLINKPKRKIQYLSIVFDILLKRYQSKNFFYKQGSKIQLSSDKSLSWTIDGEFGGRAKQVEINNCKEAVTFIVPK